MAVSLIDWISDTRSQDTLNMAVCVVISEQDHHPNEDMAALS